MGKAAVRGHKGVLETTMALRQRPFGEWVVIYYHPAKTNGREILRQLQRGGCKRARLIREEGEHATVMNPIITPGNLVQWRVRLREPAQVKTLVLPEGWALHGGARLPGELAAGTHYLSLQSPTKARKGQAAFRLEFRERAPLTGSAEVVSRVP